MRPILHHPNHVQYRQKKAQITSTFSARVVPHCVDFDEMPFTRNTIQPKMRNTILNNPTPAPLELRVHRIPPTNPTRTPTNPTLLIEVHNTPQTRKPSFPRNRLAPTERKITMQTPPPSMHVLASAH